MSRMGDQDATTNVVSLGLLANGLGLLLAPKKRKALPFRADLAILGQWKSILQETIDFIQAPDNKFVGQGGRSTRFLSQAEYLEQIYTATPNSDRKSLKKLATYLKEILNDVAAVSENKVLGETARERLIGFSQSLAREAIKEASEYQEEAHERKNPDVGPVPYVEVG